MKQQITKNAIKNAYISLLSTKAIDKITVRDIVDECGLTRNTFYYYYKDIYEIAEELLEESTYSIIDEYCAGKLTTTQLFNALDKLFNENYKIFSNMFLSGNDGMMIRYLDGFTERILTRYLEIVCKDVHLTNSDKHFFYGMFKYMMRGAFSEYIKSGKTSMFTEFSYRFEKIFDEQFIKNLKDSQK